MTEPTQAEAYAAGSVTLTPGRIATLTLNAPATRNAMSSAMWAALAQVAARVADDPAIRVLVVTGAGGTFSAGADISEFAEVYASAESAAAYNATIRSGLAALQSLPRPVIARIEGPCVGGGVAIALACDLRFAATDAIFAIPPARLGIAYSPEDTAMLVAQIGAARAKDMLFSARRLDVAEAQDIGLIERVEDALDAAIIDYAGALADLSPASIRQAKATINALQPATDDTALRTSFAALFTGPDFTEGRAAFLERRKPRF